MGTCLALHRIEADRLAEAETDALEAVARRLPIDERLSLDPSHQPGLEIARLWLDALDRAYLDVYDLSKLWTDVAALTFAHEWAGLWRPPLPYSSPVSRAVFGTHLPPRAIAATLDFPIRVNTSAEVQELLPALEQLDLEDAFQNLHEHGRTTRYFRQGDSPLTFWGRRTVEGVTSLYRRAAEHGHAVVAAMY